MFLVILCSTPCIQVHLGVLHTMWKCNICVKLFSFPDTVIEWEKKSQNKENNFVDSSHFQNHEVCYALFCLCSALDTNCGANQGLALILRSLPG